MFIGKKTKDFLAYSLDLLSYKKGITFLNIFCNAVIFSRMAAITLIIRQVLNILEHSQGSALRLAMPYLFAILAVVIIRVAAIMGCAALDTLRAYHYQNRVRVNVLRMLLRKADITGVAGRSGPIFEVLGNDIPISTFPVELLTEVTGFFIFTLIALSTMLAINWQLTLFIFIPLSAAIYGIQRLSERIKERRQANREAQDRASLFVADIIDASLAVKASGAEEPVLKHYELVNKNRRAAALKDTLLNAKISVLLGGAVHVGSAIMMFAAAHLMTGGSFGLGDFSLFIAYLGTLADCVNRIVELIAESRRAEVSYERIMGIACAESNRALNREAGVSLHGSVRRGSVESVLSNENCSHAEALEFFEARDLSFSYDDGEKQGSPAGALTDQGPAPEFRGFRNVSFKLGPGQLMAVSGEIGSGKSALLSVLAGLMPPDSGECLFNGKPLSSLNHAPIAGAPQRSGVFSGSLRENISLGLPLPDDEILKALSLAALDEFAASECLDLDPGSRGDKLSGGQRQRLALARLFARGAKLLIIDDCVSALDHVTRKRLLNQILSYLKRTGRSAIIATNEPEFINAADQVLPMKKAAGCGL